MNAKVIQVYVIGRSTLHLEAIVGALNRCRNVHAVGAEAERAPGEDLPPCDVVVVADANDHHTQLPLGARKLVVIVHPDTTDEVVDWCLDHRVSAVVDDALSPRELAKVIQAVYTGHSVYSSDVAFALIRHLRGGLLLGRPTAREREIWQLLEQGLTNEEIATSLHIEIRTVKTHLHHLFRKLGVRNRLEAIAQSPHRRRD